MTTLLIVLAAIAIPVLVIQGLFYVLDYNMVKNDRINNRLNY